MNQYMLEGFFDEMGHPTMEKDAFFNFLLKGLMQSRGLINLARSKALTSTIKNVVAKKGITGALKFYAPSLTLAGGAGLAALGAKNLLFPSRPRY